MHVRRLCDIAPPALMGMIVHAPILAEISQSHISLVGKRTIDQWDEVRMLLAVVEGGTVRAAAEALELNHATIIRGVARLEKRLNTTLFERLATGYRLTTAGGDIVALASQMATASARIEARILGRGPEPWQSRSGCRIAGGGRGRIAARKPLRRSALRLSYGALYVPGSGRWRDDSLAFRGQRGRADGLAPRGGP